MELFAPIEQEKGIMDLAIVAQIITGIACL